MNFPTEKRPIFAIFLLIAAAGSLFADFRLQSLAVFMNVNQDGSVNVEESLNLAMNGSSTQLYRDTRSAYSDLATWQNRTGLSEMRHHVSRAAADITNLRVLPQAISSCNPYVDLCMATVTLDYTVIATSENGSGSHPRYRSPAREVKSEIAQPQDRSDAGVHDEPADLPARLSLAPRRLLRRGLLRGRALATARRGPGDLLGRLL